MSYFYTQMKAIQEPSEMVKQKQKQINDNNQKIDKLINAIVAAWFVN